ncbi:hypothetical protein CMO89_02500 [Candidatus Woesearchaeota archaeon]|nr:hypothetical protein [Candidatus Woesearchaeota archaeon]
MNNKQRSNKKGNVKMIRRLRIRTKEELILEIKRLSKEDKRYLNYSFLRNIKRNDLLFEAVKHFGGWRKTVEAAGFRPIQKGWDKKEIINELIEIKNNLGFVPTRQKLRDLKRNDLEKAATRHFGSWNKALNAADLKPNKKTDWTKEETIYELKKFSKEIGHTPSIRELKENNKYNLLNSGLKFFSTYNNFLKAAGLEFILEMNKWSQSKIIDELKEIQNYLGRTPRRTELAAMKKYDLINAAETYFSSWSEALISAELVPNPDILEDDKTWREWEDLIFDFLSNNKINYEKKKYIKKVGYPDIYIPSNEKIIEIKINCSENSVKKDIKKYLPYCKRLEIWYLFGKPFGILSNKVTFVGPNKIRDFIKDNPDLLVRFDNIKNKYGGKLK